jgi:hypothetical protein
MADEYLEAIAFDKKTIAKAMNAARISAQDLDEKQLQASRLTINRALCHWSADKTSQTHLIVKSAKRENGFVRCSAVCAVFFDAPAFTPPHRIVLAWYCDYFKRSSVLQMTLDLYGQLLSDAPSKIYDGGSRF